MLPQEELDRIAIVLVRARNPNNIGAVARAMHDFGFRNLRLVNDYSVPLEAARSAIDASSVLASAREFASVADAVADCTLVAGTTAVGERDLQHPLLALSKAAPKILQSLTESPEHGGSSQSQPRAALLFGSEKTGLSNDELSHCNWLLTIPMYPHPDHRHPSMNLGQAVAVCLYELVRQRELPATGRSAAPATAGDLERLTSLLEEVLEASEYNRHHPANSGPADLRRLLLRLQFDRTDTPVWMGILRQILWKLRLASPEDSPSRALPSPDAPSD
ncbi:MAG TPA: TrmH family RNA methyltransferase [Granulicella sp.]|jgi:TrmH family RNA methyltransferase|nr:TrmH family RNA methyltransferase [Granulicella sp.]